jgi:hypothetical protein
MTGLVIYVAGAYSPPAGVSGHDAPVWVQHNVDLAIDAGIALLRKGHTPYVPHLTHYINLRVPLDNPISNEAWYQIDNRIVRKCDGLLLISHSRGADAEVELAKQIGIPVWYSLDEVPKA